MDVSVIIVNYHTEELILNCIKSVLEKTSDVDYEIIVVDNAPMPNFGDELEAAFNKKASHPIRYLKMPENPGFGMANNAGFELAQGEFLFCLNPDTLLVNNAIGILHDYMKSHKDCGACGGNLYHMDMRRALSMRRILPGIFWEISESMKLHPERLRYGRNTRFNHTRRPMDVGYITGADLMLRADVTKELGGFSPDFFMYFEETDLCCRINKMGYRIVSLPQARIIHLEGKSFSTEKVNTAKLRYYEESRAAYYRRNVNGKTAERAHRIYLRSLRKNSTKAGLKGEISRIRLEYALKAIADD